MYKSLPTKNGNKGIFQLLRKNKVLWHLADRWRHGSFSESAKQRWVFQIINSTRIIHKSFCQSQISVITHTHLIAIALSVLFPLYNHYNHCINWHCEAIKSNTPCIIASSCQGQLKYKVPLKQKSNQLSIKWLFQNEETRGVNIDKGWQKRRLVQKLDTTANVRWQQMWWWRWPTATPTLVPTCP